LEKKKNQFHFPKKMPFVEGLITLPGNPGKNGEFLEKFEEKEFLSS